VAPLDGATVPTRREASPEECDTGNARPPPLCSWAVQASSVRRCGCGKGIVVCSCSATTF